MPTPTQVQNRLCNEAFDAEHSGRRQEAARLFREAVLLDSDNPVPYLFLGYTRYLMGEEDRAVQAWSLAADLDPRVINAWRNEGAAPEIRERSRLADKRLREYLSRLHRESVQVYLRQHPGANVERVEAAIWCQTHDAGFEYRHPRQRPHLFFVPDITPIAVYGDEYLPWRSSVERSFGVIRDELSQVRESAAASETPYLEPRAAWLGEEWKPIADSLNWGSYQLYRRGVPSRPLLQLFPATLAILDDLPIIKGHSGPREVVFSVLQGQQRIPPHYGVSNTDMTVHLPIITTDESAIRVADEVHFWEEGRIFAFDDSFDHESWNDSPEPRVNLIFEVWHPELTDHERGAIAAAFDARDRWNEARRI